MHHLCNLPRAALQAKRAFRTIRTASVHGVPFRTGYFRPASQPKLNMASPTVSTASASQSPSRLPATSGQPAMAADSAPDTTPDVPTTKPTKLSQEMIKQKEESKRREQMKQAARLNALPEAQREQLQQKKQKVPKAPKTVGAQLARAIGEAARDSDLGRALEAFRESQEKQVKLQLHSFNTLLYLTCGGDMWESLARAGDPDKAAADNVRTATTGPAPALAPEPAVSTPASSGTSRRKAAASTGREQQSAQPAAVSSAKSNGQAVAMQTAEAPAPGTEGSHHTMEVGKQNTTASAQGEGVEAATGQQAAGEGVQGDGSAAGASGGAPASHEHMALSMSRAERVTLAQELWAAMQQAGHKPDGASYLALARLEGLGRQPDAALKWAQEAADNNCAVGIRNFSPALVGYCMHRDAEGVLRTEQCIAKHANVQEMDLSEYEFARLFEGLACDTRMPWAKIEELLLRMGRELEGLSQPTLDLIAAYFSSPQSAAALPQTHTSAAQASSSQGVPAAAGQQAGEGIKGKRSPRREEAKEGPPLKKKKVATAEEESSQGLNGTTGLAREEGAQEANSRQPCASAGPAQPWHLETVKVDSKGMCASAGCALQVVDLEEEEWIQFADGIANLARTNENVRNAGQSNFDQYIEWYERNGPYDIMIDGANVAFFGQNWQEGGFSWAQIMRMTAAVRQAHPDRKVLLMLHKSRTKNDASRKPEVQEFLEQLTEENAFYSTPYGSNDDWYWLYATVRARSVGLLISNDELRDHIFSLLRPKHFLKWKARHIAQYDWPGHNQEFILKYPPAYTTCVQLLQNGVWMFPSAADDTWLCVRPNRPAV